MMVTFYSCVLTGLDPSLIGVEVDLSNGLPRCEIVGLPDSTVQEARQRIRAAIKNSGFDFPVRRITINLTPADLRKEGSGFDLPMALGILAVSGQFSPESIPEFLILGELGLDGRVRPIPGVLAMASLLEKQGIRKLIIPKENAMEAAIFPQLDVWPVRNLQDAVSVFMKATPPLDEKISWSPEGAWPEDFEDVKGQDHAKRSLEIAAAGNHNLILIGPPGAGKTMLAQRFPGILPELSFEECLDISKIRSITGRLGQEKWLSSRRPFRTPHSTISFAGMVGGGNPVHPGELSFAHHGVLFMDELPQFRRDILESLRQPLEEKQITVVRLSGSVTYPADFLLLGTMNPCPCGFYGDHHRICICRPMERIAYRKRLSGPILDRIDLHVEVSALPHDKLYTSVKPECTGTIKSRVEKARALQKARFQSPVRTNAAMSGRELETHCRLSPEARELLQRAYEQISFSARGHSKILKIARTIADLAGRETIEPIHLAEALQYRVLDRNSLNE